jgi:death-on-curing protein
MALLESAVAVPQASFGGVYAHETLIEMATAYFYHLVSNHPFVDGNKRVGLLAMLMFLDLNGVVITQSSEQLCELTMRVARGEESKDTLHHFLKKRGDDE